MVRDPVDGLGQRSNVVTRVPIRGREFKEPRSERGQGRADPGEVGGEGRHKAKRQKISIMGRGKGMGSPPGLPEGMHLYLDVALVWDL